MKKYNITVNGTLYEVTVEETGEITSAAKPSETVKSAPKAAEPAVQKNVEGKKITAPMNGTVLDIKVSVGQAVKKGDVLVVLEAMKMENEIMASDDGKVLQIVAKKGDIVNSEDVLVILG